MAECGAEGASMGKERSRDAVMSLVHSARLNGHDPYQYLRDVLQRLPTQPASRVGGLLAHRRLPPIAAA